MPQLLVLPLRWPSSCAVQVRLVDASGTPGQQRGRLEVQINGTWGSVCTDGVTRVRHEELGDAVCRQLGLPLPARVLGSAAYGAGTGPVWSDYIDCPQLARGIEECDYNAWGAVRRCKHSGDVAIECGAQPLQLRLAGGNATAGRLEMLINGVVSWVLGGQRQAGDATRRRQVQRSRCSWPAAARRPAGAHGLPPLPARCLPPPAYRQWGTACDARFSEVSAAIACRQLGLGLPVQVLDSGPLFGATDAPMWLNWVEW